MTDLVTAARVALEAGPAALVTVLATEGSAPRGSGTRMLVTARGSHGTIGGGRLEYQAIDQARALLDHRPGDWRVQDYPLGPLLGQCCGGRVRLLVEQLADGDWLDALAAGRNVATRLEPGRVVRTPTDAPSMPLSARGERPDQFVECFEQPRRVVHLYGAGHVGMAIARALRGLPFTLAWFDTRPERDAPGVTIVPEERIADCVADAGDDAAILILTHDHALDYRLTAAALAGPARFVGLIGSRTKRARFLSRLAADGIDADRLVSPIGLPGIVGKDPATIAIAVAAQLLQDDLRRPL